MTVVVGDKMILMGGSYNQSNNSNIYSLDLKTFKWGTHKATGYQNEASQIPDSLDEHTAIPYQDNSVITFGGFVGGERSNFVHCYDI